MSRTDDRQEVLDYALFLAVSNANEHKVRQFLGEGANPNRATEGCRSAFAEAANLMMFDLAALMIAHGADVNYQENKGHSVPPWVSALLRDAMKQTTARTAFYIKHGADFSLPFVYADKPADVYKVLDDMKLVLIERERIALRAVRALVDTELAVVTRQRQQRMGNAHLKNKGKFKL